MKYFLIIGGFCITIFVCLIPLKRHVLEYKIQKEGDIVIGEVTDVPNCFGSKIRHFIKFKYESKIYSKRIGKSCEEYKVGQLINLKHLKGNDVFLYENEKVEKEIISFGILAIAGLFFIIYGFKKK